MHQMARNLTNLEVGYKQTILNQTQTHSMLTQELCLPGMRSIIPGLRVSDTRKCANVGGSSEMMK